MEAHALKYSKGYAAKKGYTFWEKDFDSMACKTMLRQLISKWGIMSVEMQTAIEKDMTMTDEQGRSVYFENDDIIETDAVIEQQETLSPDDNPFEGPEINTDDDPLA